MSPANEGDRSPAWGDMPVPPVHLLTTNPDKNRRYVMDLLMREGWATLLAVLGERAALRFAHQTAIVWLRPDAAAAGAIGEIAARIEAAGFIAVGATLVRLTRADVRALWWWGLKRATAERLMLLDAVTELGPGLLVLYRHPDGDPAPLLTQLKGHSEPSGRAPDSLRSVAGSPNRLLTMVHTSDEAADVVRELAVFLPWRERAALVASASACGSPVSSSTVLDRPLAAIRAAYAGQVDDMVHIRAPQQRSEAFAALLSDITDPSTTRRWPVVAQWSSQVPLLVERKPK